MVLDKVTIPVQRSTVGGRCPLHVGPFRPLIPRATRLLPLAAEGIVSFVGLRYSSASTPTFSRCATSVLDVHSCDDRHLGTERSMKSSVMSDLHVDDNEVGSEYQHCINVRLQHPSRIRKLNNKQDAFSCKYHLLLLLVMIIVFATFACLKMCSRRQRRINHTAIPSPRHASKYHLQHPHLPQWHFLQLVGLYHHFLCLCLQERHQHHPLMMQRCEFDWAVPLVRRLWH